MLTNLMNPALQYQWKLTGKQIQFLTATYYFGKLFGTITSGILSDRIGRRYIIIISTFGQFITILLIYFYVEEIKFFFLGRFAQGFFEGVTLPLSYLMISEIVPVNMRGKALIVPVFFELLGAGYSIYMASIYLGNVEDADWKKVLVKLAYPSAIVAIGSSLLLKESARFFLSKKQIQDALLIIDYMGRQNHKDFQQLTELEIQSLSEWVEATFIPRQENPQIKDLFTKNTASVTIRFWIIGITTHFSYAGMLFIVPYIFLLEGIDFENFNYLLIGHLLALIPLYFLIDNKFIGRKNLISYSFTLNLIVFALVYAIKAKFLEIGLLLINFLTRMVFQNWNVLIMESYLTIYRGIAVGYFYGLTKIASALSPFAVYYLFEINAYLPFLIFSILMFPNVFAMFTFPFDMTNQQMDSGGVVEYKPIQQQDNENEQQPIEVDQVKNTQNMTEIDITKEQIQDQKYEKESVKVQQSEQNPKLENQENQYKILQYQTKQL